MSDPERLALLVHELRSPVAALEALVHAAPGVRDRGQRRQLLRLAVAAARDVERLVRDPELTSLRLSAVDLAELVEGLAGESVTVRVGTGAAPTTADPTRLRQALANLVQNGLRHGSHVTVELVERSEELVVDVRDDGPGVGPGLDPFARGASGAGSSGLGLWVARAVAEAHGGSLELVADGPGAWFRLALPRASGGR